MKNMSGNQAESMIAHALDDRGVTFKKQYRIGRGIYGWHLRVDFFVYATTMYVDGLIIESKWQEVGGTADEKFPLLVMNIKQCYPCPCIVIEEGNGAREGARRWLRGQIDGVKLLYVFTLAEFMTHARREGFGKPLTEQILLPACE